MLIIKIGEDELQYFSEIKNEYPQSVIVRTEHGFDMGTSVQVMIDISKILEVALPSILAAIELVLLHRINIKQINLNKKQLALEKEKLLLEKAKMERNQFEIILSSNGERKIIARTSDLSTLKENSEDISGYLERIEKAIVSENGTN